MKLKHFLLTALLLFAGVSGIYAGRKYVGFSSSAYNNTQLQKALNEAQTGDTVFVAVGLYIATDSAFLVPANVTLIGGYEKGDATASTRRYPGQFVPFDSSNLSNTTKFTVLDGNSYKTFPAKKHRVITVNAGSVVDGCLIRNGHVRNGNGGGALLNGGKLYNSIVRGNVVINHPDSAEALGGGVFIQNGGELINCLVAYNMANDGYGVAAGVGGGKMINNTITANTYSPVFAKIPGTGTGTFKMYEASTNITYRPDGEIPKYPTGIKLRDFYISRIQTTEGQYAVFCAAMDISSAGSAPTIGKLDVGVLAAIREPVINDGNVTTRYNFNNVTGMQEILRTHTSDYEPGLKYDGGVWYPHLDTASVEYPMAWVTWWGSLAYSVWLGGGLPSQAQWEFAARSEPNGTVNDNLFSGAYGTTDDNDTVTWRILDTIAWVHRNKSIDTTAANFGKLGATWTNRPHEVARKRPNAMGLYDMAGNINEFTADFKKEITADFPYSTPYEDPINITYASDHRMTSGGAYYHQYVYNFALPFHIYGHISPGTETIGFRPIVAF